MPTPKPYSRVEFTRGWWTWARRNWRVIAILTLGLAVLIAFVITVLLWTFPAGSVRSWLLGAVPVGVVGLYLHTLHLTYLAHEPHALHHLRGAWGEENTRSELQRARRKKVVWGWVDSIGFQYGDLDHFVVTRRGGLVVADSKWRNKAYDADDMAASAKRARHRAEGVARDLLRGDSYGSRRAKVNPMRVTPVVVLWGAVQRGARETVIVDGIEFVAGRDFVAWLRALDGDPVDEDAAAELLAALKSKRDTMQSVRG